MYLVKLLARYWNCPQAELVSDVEKGDVGLTAHKYFSKYGQPAQESTLTLNQVSQWLERFTSLSTEEEQLVCLGEIIPRCTAVDLSMIVRLVGYDLNLLEKKGTLSPREKKDTATTAPPIAVMKPIRAMLAKVCKSITEISERCPNGIYAEIKYDGERIQIHKDKNEFKCFARNLKEVMPYKLAGVGNYIQQAAQSIILDAELLWMDPNTRRPLPFGSGKFNLKESLTLNHILFLNGQSLLETPIKERRVLLEKHFNSIPNRIELSELTITKPKKKHGANFSPEDSEDGAESSLKLLMAKVIKEGFEGLVIKDANSIYESDARNWIKIKKDYLSGPSDSVDLVCLGAYFGHTESEIISAYLMGVYDEEGNIFVTVCKVGVVSDEKSIQDANALRRKMVRLEKDPKRVPVWLRIHPSLVPDLIATDPQDMPIFEIVGAELCTDSTVHTAGGMYIRFPRIFRTREDKVWQDCTFSYLEGLVKSST